MAHIDRMTYVTDSGDAVLAIEILRNIINQGAGSFVTYQSVASLYQHLGEYEKERDILNEMERKYGDDYRTFMMYAYLELNLQNETEVDLRDYSSFFKYYEKAIDLYSKQNKHNSNDQQMEVLIRAYDDLEKYK